VDDEPVQKATHDAQQVVVAARSCARPRCQEGSEDLWRDLLDALDVALYEEAVE
jgi:hypothetical protein